MCIAIIGGTGVDEMSCFAGGKITTISTRYGDVDTIDGALNGKSIIFLPRHGLEHATSPGRINYRAQIAALKKVGVDRVIGVCAVGSLKPELHCGSFAVLSDFIDLTKKRVDTFFDDPEGPVVHTDFTDPYCPSISRALIMACREQKVPFEPHATYVGVEGPRYESPAEIKLYSSWGAHVVGMTNLPEVVLAREAGLCYGALAVITNLAAGISPTRLAHEEVKSAMASAGADLQNIVQRSIQAIADIVECDCRSNNSLIL